MNWLVDADVTEPLIVSQVQASGGREETIRVAGKAYRVHYFTENGSLTVTNGGEVEALLVGGGGGGGKITGDYPLGGTIFVTGGGGGAGGVLQCKINLTTINSPYAIGVGAGGNDADGGDSSIFVSVSNIPTAYGGGRGANVNLSVGAATNGGDGGSSGGGAGGAGASLPGQRVFGQGNVGTFGTSQWGGSGGGAGSAGVTPSASVRSSGGDGVISNITGSPIYYGGGGGGGSYIIGGSAALGGVGGGGQGATASSQGSNGQDGRGGGGGGGSARDNSVFVSINSPGKGGSGIVIIRYPIEG